MAAIPASPPPTPPPTCGERPEHPSPSTKRTGMLLALAAITMMFIGLTSAYVVSQGLSAEWKQVRVYPLLLVNTAVLLLSSYTLEQARRKRSMRWLQGTMALGLAFLIGQIAIFRQLAHDGLYLNTGRQVSFYYVLTGLHALHIAGGLAGLLWAAFRIKQTTLDVVSLYWHFMGGLWLHLLLVIFL
jgi:cytochrome c oxidase subunit 3